MLSNMRPFKRRIVIGYRGLHHFKGGVKPSSLPEF